MSKGKPIVFGFVYKITNQINGKAYIGITTQELEVRWRQHVGSKSTSYIHRALKRYGAENFTFEEIDRAATPGELVCLEKDYIESHNTYNGKGYNQTPGGDFPQVVPITLDGRIFDSPAVAARHYDVDLKLVRSRMSKPNWTIRQAYGIDEPPVLHSQTIRIQGVEYSSIAKAARSFGIDNRLVWKRLTNGWSEDQAVGLEPGPGSVEINGKSYDSLNDAARAHGLTGQHIRSRRRLKWGQEQVWGLAPPPRSIVLDGKDYPNLISLADSFNISRDMLRSRLRKRGWSLRQGLDLDDPPGSIRYKGELYKSKSELARVCSIRPSTFSFRLRQGWSIAQATGDETPPAQIHTGKRVEFDHAGLRYVFPSLSAASRHFGLNEGSTKSRVTMGWSWSETFELEDRKRPAQVGNESTVQGVYYANSTELALAYGLAPRLVENRMRTGWTAEEAVGLMERTGLRRSRKELISFKFEGRAYSFRSFAKAAAYFQVPSSTANLRRREKWTLPEIFGLTRGAHRKNRIEVTIGGVSYSSISKLADAYDQPAKRIDSRLRRGWTPEEAVGIRERVPKRRIIRPTKDRVQFEHNGQRYSFPTYRSACIHFGVTENQFHGRRGKGLPFPEALGMCGENSTDSLKK